jgi:spermidine/putrescine-binding protein
VFHLSGPRHGAWVTRLVALSLAAALTVGLAACGGSSSDASNSSTAPTAAQIASASGSIKVFGWQQYDQPSVLNSGPVKAQWTQMSSSSEVPIKIKPKHSFDVFVSSANDMASFLETKRLAPIDTSLLKNYNSIPAALRNNPNWAGPDKNIYGVPFAVTPGVTAYDASKTSEPKTMQDLLKPDLKGQIGVYDDPILLLSFARGLNVGDPNAPEKVTAQQLQDTVVPYLKKLAPQIKTFYPYGGEVQLFNRGDIKVAFQSYGSLITSSSKNGAKVEPSLLGAVSYADALSVLNDGKQAASMRWIDNAISPTVQPAMATKALTNSVVGRASGLPGPLDAPLEQILKEAPVIGPIPPVGQPGYKYVTREDLAKIWNSFKQSL